MFIVAHYWTQVENLQMQQALWLHITDVRSFYQRSDIKSSPQFDPNQSCKSGESSEPKSVKTQALK